MKRFLMATTALFACTLTGKANAADLPSHRPPPAYVEPPVFSWTGLYLEERRRVVGDSTRF